MKGHINVSKPKSFKFMISKDLNIFRVRIQAI